MFAKITSCRLARPIMRRGRSNHHGWLHDACLTSGRILTIAATVITFVVAGMASRAADHFVLDKAFVLRNIEPKISMPRGAHVLASYKRYYANDGKQPGYIVATFIHDPSDPGVLIVPPDQLPQVFDGGCDVLNLRYQLNSHRVLSLRCNGVG